MSMKKFERQAMAKTSPKHAIVVDQGSRALKARLGESFARGHEEASSGLVNVAEFKELCALIKLGEKPDRPADQQKGQGGKKTVEKSPQKNTLKNYLEKPDQDGIGRREILAGASIASSRFWIKFLDIMLNEHKGLSSGPLHVIRGGLSQLKDSMFLLLP